MRNFLSILLGLSCLLILSFNRFALANEYEGDGSTYDVQGGDSSFTPVESWDHNGDEGRPNEYPPGASSPIGSPGPIPSPSTLPSVSNPPSADPQSYIDNGPRPDDEYTPDYSTDYSYENENGDSGMDGTTSAPPPSDYSSDDDGSYDKGLDSQLPVGESSGNSPDTVDPDVDYYSDGY